MIETAYYLGSVRVSKNATIALNQISELYSRLKKPAPYIAWYDDSYVLTVSNLTPNQQNAIVRELTERLTDDWEIDWVMERGRIKIKEVEKET